MAIHKIFTPIHTHPTHGMEIQKHHWVLTGKFRRVSDAYGNNCAGKEL